jgi:hypothetical protein
VTTGGHAHGAGLDTAGLVPSAEEFEARIHADLVERIEQLESDAYTSSVESFEPLSATDVRVLGLVYVALPIVIAFLAFVL